MYQVVVWDGNHYKVIRISISKFTLFMLVKHLKLGWQMLNKVHVHIEYNVIFALQI